MRKELPTLSYYCFRHGQDDYKKVAHDTNQCTQPCLGTKACIVAKSSPEEEKFTYITAVGAVATLPLVSDKRSALLIGPGAMS